MYQRKTVDEYDIEGDYGDGFDVLCTEATAKEARQRVREYLENDRYLTDIRIRKHRVKKKEETANV